MLRTALAMLGVLILAGCVPICSPTWSTDGRYVAYIKYGAASGHGPGTSLLIFDMQSGELKHPEVSEPFQAIWGPAGLYVNAEVADGELGALLLEPPEFQPQPLDLPAGEEYGLAPLPDGSGLCYAANRQGLPQLAFFPYATGKEKVLAPAAEFPVVSADGKRLYAGAWQAGKPQLLRFDIAGGDVSGPAASLELSGLAKPENEELPGPLAVPLDGGLLCFVPGANSIWLLERDFKSAQRFPAPGKVWYAAALSATEVRLILSGIETSEDFVPAIFDTRTGKTRLDGAPSERPYGYGAWNPQHTIYAEVSRGGLKLQPVTGDWVRYYPETPAEKLAAAEAVLERSPLEALHFLADEPEGIDGFRWYLTKAQAAAKAGDERYSAMLFLRGSLAYPVTDLEAGVIRARLKGVAVGTDEAALAASGLLAADAADALTLLDELGRMAGSDELVAGVAFRRGFNQFRQARFQEAAKSFRKAAECIVFPQADYAALLAMVSYYLAGQQVLADDMAAMVQHKFASRAAAASLEELRQQLKIWSARQSERRLPLTADTQVAAAESADYRLLLSVEQGRHVQVERQARVRLAVLTPKPPEDPKGGFDRRELVELAGFYGGYAVRGDKQAFAVAAVNGADVSVVVVKMPGSKLAEKTFTNALPEGAKGAEVYTLAFSPSGARLQVAGPGVRGELALPETRSDR